MGWIIVLRTFARMPRCLQAPSSSPRVGMQEREQTRTTWGLQEQGSPRLVPRWTPPPWHPTFDPTTLCCADIAQAPSWARCLLGAFCAVANSSIGHR